MHDTSKLLLVDAGNTSIKWRIGSSGDLGRCAAENFSEFEVFIRAEVRQIESVALSSVQTEDWEGALQSLCTELGLDIWVAKSQANNAGLVSVYPTPESLGVDRWLAMVALWHKTRSGFLLVDMGTAITLDAVDGAGKHLGGYIVPGMNLQRKSLANASDTLQKLIVGEPVFKSGLGSNTVEAIDGGIYLSIEALIEKVMQDSGLNSEQLVIIGGDSRWFVGRKGFKVINKNLVLVGLEILWNQARTSEGQKQI